jgi:hypothetical protein
MDLNAKTDLRGYMGCILCRESSYRTIFSGHRPFVLPWKRVNVKIGSDVRFNRHIDSNLRRFTLKTSFFHTFKSNAQKCHDEINTYLLLIQFHHFPCPGSNHTSVYVIELTGPKSSNGGPV